MSEAIEALKNLTQTKDVEKVREAQRKLKMCKGDRAVDDKGEWIGAAAKDRLREQRLTAAIFETLNPLERQEELVRDKIWPKPDYRALSLYPQPNGSLAMTPEAARYIEGVRTNLTTKFASLAREDMKPNPEEAQKLYFKGINWFAENANQYKTLQQCETMRRDFMTEMGLTTYAGGGRLGENRDELKIFQLFIKRAKNARYLNCPFGKATYFEKDNKSDLYSYNGNAPEFLKDWRVHETIKGGFLVELVSRKVDLPKYTQKYWGHNTTLDAIQKAQAEGRYHDRGQPFPNPIEAVEWIKNVGLKIQNSFTTDKKAPTRRKSLKLVRGLEKPFRNSSKAVPSFVTPEILMKEFGLRAVEFGESMPDKERIDNLKKTYGALTDLSDALSITPKSIGLDGSLALAFGSRGRSSAAAHYEPGRQVINLTRRNGEGSLAHEWFHALDHFIMRKNYPKLAVTTPYLSKGLMSISSRKFFEDQQGNPEALKHRHDLVKGYMELNKSIIFASPNSERYLKAKEEVLEFGKERGITGDRLESLVNHYCKDKRTTYINDIQNYFDAIGKPKSAEYWVSDVECFARVGESFVEQRLNDKSLKSTYLVAATLESTMNGHHLPFNAYPVGEDREVMFQNMKNFLHVALGKEMELRKQYDLEAKTKPPEPKQEPKPKIEAPVIPKRHEVKSPVQSSFGF